MPAAYPLRRFLLLAAIVLLLRVVVVPFPLTATPVQKAVLSAEGLSQGETGTPPVPTTTLAPSPTPGSGTHQGTVATPPAGGILVNTESSTFSWAGSESWGQGVGGLLDDGYLFTWNSAFKLDTWGRWNVGLSQPGYWDVYVWIPKEPNATLNARYRVFHAALLGPVIMVDQRAMGGNWVWLGNYYFNASANEYVYLNDVTFEAEDSTWVLFDAVKFTFGAQP